MDSQEQVSSANCATCGHELTGKYCPQCGEKVLHEKDKRVAVFFEEFVHILFHADNKFLRTFKKLFRKPGSITGDYLAGKRKMFTSPLTLFFIGNFIYYLLPTVDVVSSRYVSQTQGQVYSASIITRAEHKRIEKKWTPGQMQEHYDDECGHVSKMMLVLMIFLFSLPLAMLFYGKRTYYYDHVVFATEVMSFLIYGMFLLLPALLVAVMKILGYGFNIRLSGDAIVNSIWTVGSLSLVFWTWLAAAAKAVYRQSWPATLIKTFIVVLSTVGIVILYRYILFYVTLTML